MTLLGVRLVSLHFFKTSLKTPNDCEAPVTFLFCSAPHISMSKFCILL